MTTVAVFGGSFSPVHSGHINVASQILKLGLADEVWLMPCRLNPLKDKKELMGDEERLGLLRMAEDYCREKGVKGLRVSEVELSMPEPSYTCHTLRRLREENPDKEFRLVCGADSYLDFEKWKDYKWIEENFSPIVYPRPGYETGPLRPGWTRLENVKEIEVSSTRIRDRIASGDVPFDMMPWLKTKTMKTTK